MTNINDILISPETTILSALEALGESQQKILLVVDQKQKLLGTIVDGDIRRAILRKQSLEDSVDKVMTTEPVTIRNGVSSAVALRIMQDRQISHIPIVDDDNRVLGLEILAGFLQSKSYDNWVVLMVGGLGSRLRPLTETTPKPMLCVGGQPMLETIIEKFRAQGFQRFFLSVNYKAEMIESYFGDGARWGVSIDYLYEDSPLGTAGALSLLPEKPTAPVFVMNGDILTTVDFTKVLSFHKNAGADATICLREYDIEVPFGVVSVQDQFVWKISEKPVQSFFVNAGIYLLDPDVVAAVPGAAPLDMPDLISGLLAQGQKVAAFPLREYWIDIGRLQDFERAQTDFDDLDG